MPQDFKRLLSEFVALKSISTDAQILPEIAKTVAWLTNQFASHHFSVQTFQGPTTNPIILANLTVNRQLPTVLVYGHYDVQPAKLEDGWFQNPFTLVEKNGRLIGRGVVDNKGQVLIHIYTAFKLLQSGQLKYNIKFLLEGNEETANPDLLQIMLDHKVDFRSDYVLVSDGEISGNHPSLDVSLRGGFNLTLTYKTASTNVHSGIYGGAVPNAAYELSKLLAMLYNAKNICQVPGFYDQVDHITLTQIKNNLTLKHKPLLKNAAIKQLLCEPNTDFFTQTGLRPTIQVSGIKSGYVDAGYANIVPAQAEARLNFRLVSSQDPKAVIGKFKSWVKTNTPSYVAWTLHYSGIHKAVKINTTSPVVTKVKQLLKSAYGLDPVTKNVGGAIPFITDIKEHFKVDALSVSLANEDCNMHGANENFKISLIDKGLKFSYNFFTS